MESHIHGSRLRREHNLTFSNHWLFGFWEIPFIVFLDVLAQPIFGVGFLDFGCLDFIFFDFCYFEGFPYQLKRKTGPNPKHPKLQTSKHPKPPKSSQKSGICFPYNIVVFFKDEEQFATKKYLYALFPIHKRNYHIHVFLLLAATGPPAPSNGPRSFIRGLQEK